MINFKDAKLLGYNHQKDFFGDNLNYAVKKNISVQGCLYNLDNGEGVSEIWDGIDGLIESATDYDDIIINGVNFGSGRINSLRFAEGNDVRRKDYTVELTIFSEGNLFNMTGSDFTGITLPNIHLTERFSEDFEFTIAPDGTYSYRQSVSVKYIKDKTITDPIQAAKDLAAQLLNSSPSYGFIDSQYAGFYTSIGRRTYTESYNSITNDCSFTENFIKDVSEGNYSLKYTHEIITEENGITTVSESGHIEGLAGPDYMASAKAGLAIEIGNSYTRSVEMFNYYVPGANALATFHIALQERFNIFDNSIDYTVKYTNDPKIQDSYIWEYTEEVSRDEGCFYLVKESGRIKGINSDCIESERYNNALNGWTVVKSDILTRLNAFYLQATGLNNTLNQISTSERFAPRAGEISYTYIYSDDLTFNLDGVKRIQIQIEDNFPVHYVNKFQVVNVQELVQDLGIVKEARRNVSVKIIGHRGTQLNKYLTVAKSKINPLVPTGNDVYINGCSYNLTPGDNNFDISLNWVYFATSAGKVFL